MPNAWPVLPAQTPVAAPIRDTRMHTSGEVTIECSGRPLKQPQSGIKLQQQFPVLQHDLPLTDFRKFENMLAAKVGQSAGYGLERKTQIVRDITPAHRQSRHACSSQTERHIPYGLVHKSTDYNHAGSNSAEAADSV